MPPIDKKVRYSKNAEDIHSALQQVVKLAVQPEEDLHYASGTAIVSLDKLKPVYITAIQAADLCETKAKVYVRRTGVKLKVRLEQPATGQWQETMLTTPFKGTLESTASTLWRNFINDSLGFRHCIRSEPKMVKD